MRKFLILLVPFLIITGCHKKETFTIKGIINEKSRKTISLNKVIIDKLAFIDSAKINRKGKFHFKVRSKEPDFYQLGYSPAEFVTLLAEPGEKITIEFKGKSLLGGYSVKGSEGSEKIRMLDYRLAETKRKLDSLTIEFDKASRLPGFEQKGAEINNAYITLIKDLRKKNIEFIISNLKSMSSMMALYQKIDENTYVLYDPRDLQYLKIVSDSLSRKYPNSINVKALAENFKNELARMNARQIQNIANSQPELKLDPELKDINGRTISLSSLKGKIVLLAFWSAKSKECIADNLTLKDIYKKYRKLGFEIYQINLDESEDDWRKGVRFDDLPWINTRENDPNNPVNARLFNVRTLPANYLFDRTGAIVATNLFGKSLQIKLEQMFNN